MLNNTIEKVNSKVIDYKALADFREHNKEKKIALCHGTFDVLHPGHINHLEESKNIADLLVVTLTAEEYILKKKKTFFSDELRAKQIAALEIVDCVALIYESTALTPIEYLKPDFYVKGSEFENLTEDPTSNILREKDMVEKYGGKIYFTHGDVFSSTKIGHFLGISSEPNQNQLFSKEGTTKFKDLSREKLDLHIINDYLRKSQELKICVIGETIIDECNYIKLRSISNKSKCISGEEINQIRQIGGGGIVALHLSNFVKHVDFYTNNSSLKIKSDNINTIAIAEGDIIKTRYTDKSTNNVVYEHKIIPVLTSDFSKLKSLLNYDLVVVIDFGHGLISSENAEKLSKMNSKFFAVQAQSNSSNFGFNIIDKYPFADYYSMNKLEAQLLIKKQYEDDKLLKSELEKHLKTKQFAITFSEKGAYIRDSHSEYELEALSTYIVDTIGCGDAFLAFSSLALAQGFSAKYSLFLGSIGSAIMSQKIINESPVNYQEFLTACKIVI